MSLRLHTASTKDEIGELILKGHNIDAIDANGRTALHIMATKGNFECTMALLSHGCEVNIADVHGNTPLHSAAEGLHNLVLKALVVFEADLDCRNIYDQSARHLVAAKPQGPRSEEAIFILRSAGAKKCTIPEESCSYGCLIDESIHLPRRPPPNYFTPPKKNQFFEIYEKASIEISKSNLSSTGYRMLCLDGGGIRGLVLISMLMYLEKVVGQPIVHCFDWISGTSTGAILALALSSGKTLHECLCLYFRLKENVFEGNRPYPNEPLESFLKDVFGNAMMSDIPHPKVLVMGLRTDKTPADLHIFRNYVAPFDMLPNMGVRKNNNTLAGDKRIWEAARASGAAPSYFRIFEHYLDGGLIANNPTLDTLTELDQMNVALKNVGRGNEVKNAKVVVSLGTGIIPTTPGSTVDVFRPSSFMEGLQVIYGATNLLNLLIDQATQSDGRVVERAYAWCSNAKVPYYRFNPPLSRNIPIDEKDDAKLIGMLYETKTYMRNVDSALIGILCSVLTD